MIQLCHGCARRTLPRLYPATSLSRLGAGGELDGDGHLKVVTALVFGDELVEHGADALAYRLVLAQDQRRDPHRSGEHTVPQFVSGRHWVIKCDRSDLDIGEPTIL